ncbi:hypothetical protein F383_16995 [Gossypium arboreum]|uniref:Uncharacterized protein n=1 Tax=Gossypium arboreum TaxID=29729 RepID=A0A0B0MFX8_GOSAR|nr:hypothetical protein F383_37512 [Gossypium arboreum]KHG15283.1 hypothetical protein F383_16995 [Gossypium arboreum]
MDTHSSLHLVLYMRPINLIHVVAYT